jgi:pimeloyl-ACP methyl ester carboxylesterase/predicted transcriptional regulator YdeE
MRAWLLVLLVCFATPGWCAKAKANGIEIWYEEFGASEDPALLLIMGGCSQGIFWPTEFCERLADQGFHVIRYDHRDVGKSTAIDFATDPYDLGDMAEDAVGLLDALEISQAHLMGLSMGGPISELVAGRYPDRVASVTLIATSPDFEPMDRAYGGKPPMAGETLSRPNPTYVAWVNELLYAPPQTFDELLEARVHGFRLLNGTLPFDEEACRQLQRQFLKRQTSDTMANHLLAIQLSLDLIREAPYQVSVPTLIIHGSEDVIFPADHGRALAAAIPHATYLPIRGMGHMPNPHLYNRWIRAFLRMAHTSQDPFMKKVRIDQDTKKIVGITVRTNNQAEANATAGKIFPCVQTYFHQNIASQIPHRVAPGTTYCVYCDYASDHQGDYTYLIGEEVSSFAQVPSTLTTLTIPAQKYIKFTCGPGAMPEVLRSAWQQIWDMSPKELGGQRRYAADYEVYDERAADHQNLIFDIYVGIQ